MEIPDESYAIILNDGSLELAIPNTSKEEGIDKSKMWFIELFEDIIDLDKANKALKRNQFTEWNEAKKELFKELEEK